VRPPTISNTYSGISFLIAFTKSACTQRCTRFGSSLPKTFEFCLLTVPTGPDWSQVQRLQLWLERDGDRVRLITRGGYDWTKRYPWIVVAALTNRQKRFVIDGEGRHPGCGRYLGAAANPGPSNLEAVSGQAQLIEFDVRDQRRKGAAVWKCPSYFPAQN
jgi:hypothetical protein